MYLGKGDVLLVLTVGLRRRDDSPRWKEIIEPAPRRFAHHLELHSGADIDNEVRCWLQEAWEGAARRHEADRRLANQRIEQTLLRSAAHPPNVRPLKLAEAQAQERGDDTMTKLKKRKGRAEDESGLPAGLAAPARRALAAAGYTQLEQLSKVSEAELMQLHGMGPRAMEQIRAALRTARLARAPKEGTLMAKVKDNVNKSMQKITPSLWFDNQAEEAVHFYTSIFKNSKVVRITRFGKEGVEVHGRPEGTVMTVKFQIEGQEFVALNGGPVFKFNEAISFHVSCDSQEEVDYYWGKLSEGGDEKAQQCGWLKDKYGVSWQIIPAALHEMLEDPDPAKSERVMKAMLQMKKMDIETLKQAYEQ